MASAKGENRGTEGAAQSRVVYGERMSPPQPTRECGECCELPHGVQGILAYFLLIYADALSSSNSVSCHIWRAGGKAEVWGQLPSLPQCRIAPVSNV